jgi:hypothetical protein
MLAETVEAVKDKYHDMKAMLPYGHKSSGPLELVRSRPKISAAVLLGFGLAVALGFYVGPELVRYIKMKRM